MRRLVTFGLVVLCLALAGCGKKSHSGAQGPTLPEQPQLSQIQEQLIFNDPRFTNNIALHIPNEGFGSLQILASIDTITWDSAVRLRHSCTESGDHSQVRALGPYFDEYELASDVIANDLVASGVQRVESVSLTIPDSPWGPLTRTYSCVVNNDTMQQYVPGQNIHAPLDIPVGYRVCKGWSYFNQYDTAVPGQGTVHVLAGTISFEMAPLAEGVAFGGDGTVSIKLHQNPDNGSWVIDTYEVHDPPLTFSGLRGVRPRPRTWLCPDSQLR